jgi:hypothetical protein
MVKSEARVAISSLNAHSEGAYSKNDDEEEEIEENDDNE